MNLHDGEQTLNGGHHLSSSGRADAPYEPSISSSVSSQASVFSESCSISSSIASSISDDFRLNHEEARDKACAQLQIQSQLSLDNTDTATAASQANCPAKAWDPPAPSYADVTSLPKEQRQNPRRSFCTRNQKPPALVRQDDRKSNFVESLVGKPLHTFSLGLYKTTS